jgi:thiopeptide-type bacteriocin biosynthesis protein
MIRHSDFYLLRRPTVSIEQLNEFHDQLSETSPELLLKAHYQDPLAQESIFVASPALFERFQLWLSGETLSEKEKLLSTLYKYLIRTCTRSTPYGLFSGCVLGEIGKETSFEISRAENIDRHIRIDFECLIVVKEWLLEQPAMQRQLKLYPNTSLYLVGDNYRYIEEFRNQAERNYFISSIEGNAYLSALFDLAKQGATLQELTGLLIRDGIDPEESREFLQQLLDNKILVFDLETVITGPDFLDVLISKISSLSETSEITARLLDFKRMLIRTDNRMDMYRQLRGAIEKLTLQPVKQDFIHVDTFFRYTQNVLKEETVQHIQRMLTKLLVLNKPNTNRDLDDFRRRFSNRYEEEEVSLVMALDLEIGIGYGSYSSMGASYTPMIDELSLPSASESNKTQTVGWWQKFVLEKYTQTLLNPCSVLELTDSDLAHIANNRTGDKQPLAFSFYAFGNLLADHPDSVENGKYLFNLLACNGPSSVNIMSRFYEGSAALNDQLKGCAQQEELHSPDVVFAEIIYCPDSRAGNIMARPSLYQYEIPYMGKSSVEAYFQIPIQDIMVSVRSGLVMLRSKRLNKRIIPRLSNAHNYQTGLPIYRFLCDLQHQDSHLNIRFDWDLLSDQSYLPQVRYKHIIISRASWLLQSEGLREVKKELLAGKLRDMGLPNQFFIVSGDNELFVDMTVPYALVLLWQALQKEKTVRIKEFLATPENCLLKHDGRKFASEIVIPFTNTAVAPIRGLSLGCENSLKRRFLIGSEWLYLKIYTGEKSSDSILIQSLYPVIRQLLVDQVIDKFFFIRYADPDPHLRLRFHGNPHLDFYRDVIRAIEKVLEQNIEIGVVHKIQVDTYNRELERYGMEQMELCETLFHYDSLAILNFLHQAGEAYDESQRFLFAVRQINKLLATANISFVDRHALMEKLKEAFFEEFNGNSILRKQLGEKYRFFKIQMDPIFRTTEPDTEADLYVKQLSLDIANKKQLLSVLSSLVHMTVNRIFPSKQRAYELILYHCLAKQYASEKIRATQGGSDQ